jgi:adenosine deaminase/adenosine deaminase CECR1
VSLSFCAPLHPSLYLEKIRNNEAQLTAFSPNAKGGDLHHHFSGSIYAEPILEDAIAEDFYPILLLWKCLWRNLPQETGRNSLQ